MEHTSRVYGQSICGLNWASSERKALLLILPVEIASEFYKYNNNIARRKKKRRNTVSGVVAAAASRQAPERAASRTNSYRPLGSARLGEALTRTTDTLIVVPEQTLMIHDRMMQRVVRSLGSSGAQFCLWREFAALLSL